MVGRRVLLRVEKGPAQPGDDRARGREPRRCNDDRGVAARRRRLASTCAPARSSASPASPATASRSCSRRSPACAARASGDDPARRQAARRRGARSARRCARLRPRACAGGPPPHGPRPAVRGLRERHPRLSATSRSTARACSSTSQRHRGRRARRRWRNTTSARATPLLKTANFSGGNQQKIVLAREIERDPDGAARRPADARRRHRRHRVHPQAASSSMRDAGKAILLVSVELDEIRSLSDRILVMCGGRIVGERRPGGDRRAGARPADGRRRAQERAAMSAPLTPAAALGRCRADPAAQPRRSPSSSPASSCWPSARTRSRPSRSWSTARSAIAKGIGYTLYYATNFIFTGLAVAVAFHAGLFNIGGEGQAYIGGLGAALVGARTSAACRGYRWSPLAIIAAAAVRRRSGRSFPAICRPSAAATSSSPRSCSTSSPPR